MTSRQPSGWPSEISTRSCDHWHERVARNPPWHTGRARRDAGVVDRSGLENRKGRQALGGSNPSPSAAATLVTYRKRVVTSAARSARGTQATMTPSSTLSASKKKESHIPLTDPPRA